MLIHKNILGGGHLLGTSGAILALLLGVMLFPTTPDAAHAEETGSTATLAIDPSIAISIPGEVSFAVTPTATGEFASGSATLSVSTNNSSGYALYLSAPDGNALKSLNPDTSATVAALSQPATSDSDDFANNTWGYNLGTTAPDASATYQAVPLDQSQPQRTTEAPTNDTYTLTFGAKVDNTMPSGTYTSTVTISVVANPVILTWDELVLMQDMNPSACAGAPVGATKRLKDDRDGKLYWVAKLADNQCWMTQNLDFDIPEGGLTNENGLAAKTDLPDGTVWDSTSGANAPQPTNTTIENVYNDSNYYSTYSYDPGYYVKSDPDAYDNYCNLVSGLNSSSCTGAGWVNVGEGSGYTALTEEQADSTSSGSLTYEVTVVDEQAKAYDAHYLVGNMYQYTAATAGTGGSLNSYDDATGSICPKGWTLPSDRKSDYSHLTSAYSISSNSAGSTAITQAPLYFSPAGYVSSGSLLSAGYGGLYWSSTAGSSSGAYNLFFYSGYVSPSRSNPRYSGRSVRCLAR